MARDSFAVERKQNERKRTVVGQELALDDLVVANLVDEIFIGFAFRQLGGKDGAGDLAGLGRLAGRKQRHFAGHPLDELQFDDEIAQGFNRLPRQQLVAGHDDQNIIFA